jgi:hypothetical protein
VLREVVEQVSDAPPRCFMGSFSGFAHEMFELGKDLLDWVQIGAVGRQEQEPCADAPDCVADGGPLVAGEIVHDDDIARRECRDEALLNIIKEAVAVDRLVQHTGRVDTVTAQGGEEGHGFPMTVWGFGMKPLALGSPAPQRSHVGLGPSFVNEDEPRRIKPPLIFLPLCAPPGDFGAELFGGQNAFF